MSGGFCGRFALGKLSESPQSAKVCPIGQAAGSRLGEKLNIHFIVLILFLCYHIITKKHYSYESNRNSESYDSQ